MTHHTTMIPCYVTYSHNPLEKETEWEPSVPEEFTVYEMKMGSVDIMQFVDNHCFGNIDDVVYNYLKEDRDEWPVTNGRRIN